MEQCDNTQAVSDSHIGEPFNEASFADSFITHCYAADSKHCCSRALMCACPLDSLQTLANQTCSLV